MKILKTMKRITGIVETVERTELLAADATAKIQTLAEFVQAVRITDAEREAFKAEIEAMANEGKRVATALFGILDHVFFLTLNARRTAKPNLAANIVAFQNACHSCLEPLKIVPVIPMAGERYDSDLHQLADTKQTTSADATVALTLAQGFVHHGKVIRRAIVALR